MSNSTQNVVIANFILTSLMSYPNNNPVKINQTRKHNKHVVTQNETSEKCCEDTKINSYCTTLEALTSYEHDYTHKCNTVCLTQLNTDYVFS